MMWPKKKVVPICIAREKRAELILEAQAISLEGEPRPALPVPVLGRWCDHREHLGRRAVLLAVLTGGTVIAEETWVTLASLILTTDCMIAQAPEKPAEAQVRPIWQHEVMSAYQRILVGVDGSPPAARGLWIDPM